MKPFLKIYLAKNVQELQTVWMEIIKDHFTEQTLCLLEGPVGAGKTTSLQQICALYGMTEVSSPSFALHHRYENTQGLSIDHVDLYRLQSIDDLESTGFWDLFSAPKAWIFVEWSDLLDAKLWPLGWKKINVQISVDAHTQYRKLTLSSRLD